MLTDQEHNALQFIRDHWQRYERSPTLKEIGLAIGVQSRGTVHRYVSALEEKGYLQRESGQTRGLVLKDAMPIALQELCLPLVGKIAAGLPIEAIEDQQELNLAQMFAGPDLFALRVTGDSMMDIGILDDDYVIIRKQAVAEDGDIVVAMIDGTEATLKRFRRRPNHQIALIPENSHMQPMIYDAARVSVHGILVGQLRNYR